MRIAIDALGIHYYGGGRSAILGLLEGLFSIDHENEYYVFLNRHEPSISAKKNAHQVISPFNNRFITRIWAQITFPNHTRNSDIIHHTKNLGVFGLSIPSVVTIHDLTTLVHPELFPLSDVLYWKTLEKRTVRNASRVIAVSQNTANDICKYYGIPTGKIQVIFNSISPRFKPASTLDVAKVREKYHLPERYILHVGRIDLKKKLTLLVEAFALAKRISGTDFSTSLVLVGEVYHKSQDQTLQPTIERLGLTSQVLFTGGVPDNDLPAIYSGADTTISASVHEGFGLSAVESIACGTPLIAYQAGALPEVVGEAALLVDTLDKESIASALVKINNDEALRSDLREKGLIRAQKYKGELNSRQTLKLYEQVILENPRGHPA